MRLLSLSWCRTIAILAAVLFVAPIGKSGTGLVIGYLTWNIVETGTSRILDRGEGPVYLDDVVVSDSNTRDGRFTPKYIRLTGSSA